MPSPITTHVLDTLRGVPAAAIETTLEWREAAGGSWHLLGSGRTNENGRITDLMPPDAVLRPGLYCLTFQAGDYLTALGVSPVFFPVIRIEFSIPGERGRSHYHVPLLLSPFSYTTYLGS